MVEPMRAAALVLEDLELINSLLAQASPPAAPVDQGLALVAREGEFGDRYRVWRGRSGQRYVVTVMPLSDAIRTEQGVVLVVAVEPDGARHVVWAGESGRGLPGLHVFGDATIEAHVHLIAPGAASRQAALSDLVSGTQSYSSVLTSS
jgi:hypothetical protein